MHWAGLKVGLTDGHNRQMAYYPEWTACKVGGFMHNRDEMNKSQRTR